MNKESTLLIGMLLVCMLFSCSQNELSMKGVYVAKYPGNLKAGLLKYFGTGFYSLGDSMIVREDGTLAYYEWCNGDISTGVW